MLTFLEIREYEHSSHASLRRVASSGRVVCHRTLAPDHLEYYFSMNRRNLRPFGGEIIF
jgi:hypothetical protein